MRSGIGLGEPSDAARRSSRGNERIASTLAVTSSPSLPLPRHSTSLSLGYVLSLDALLENVLEFLLRHGDVWECMADLRRIGDLLACRLQCHQALDEAMNRFEGALKSAMYGRLRGSVPSTSATMAFFSMSIIDDMPRQLHLLPLNSAELMMTLSPACLRIAMETALARGWGTNVLPLEEVLAACIRQLTESP